MAKNNKLKQTSVYKKPEPKPTAQTKSVQQPKQPTSLSRYWTMLIPVVCVCIIIGLSYMYLYQRNSDVFYMVQLHSLFNDTSEFFHNCMDTPGGFLQWMSLWCTQLFYHPGTGIALLTAMWVILFFLLQRAFRITAAATPLILIPISALIVSEIDLGYWLYILKVQGYYFRDTLGLICLALIVWLSRADKWSVAGSVVAALAYPLIGFYSPLALLCILITNGVSRRWISAAIALCLGIVSPIVWHNLYDTMLSSQWYTIGFPVFDEGTFTDWDKSMPFVIVIVSLLVFSVIPSYQLLQKKVYMPITLCVVCFVISVCAVDKYQYDDENYRAECRVYADAENQNWEDLLSTVAGVRVQITRQLIVFKNIALFETGDAGNSMYHYDDFGITPNTPDSLRMPMSDIASSLILLYHGKTYFAYRWAMENVVEFGYNVAQLKVMTIASLINGEPKLAEKYLNILSHTMYYKEWADRYRPCIKDPNCIRKYPEVKHIIALYNYMGDMIDNDMGITEKYLMNYYSNSICVDNPYVQELCMAYAMMTKDIPTFWRQFNVYAHFHNTIPIHYQEAAYLYGKLEPQTMDTSHMPFDKQKIVDRYAAFTQRTQQLVQMRLSEQEIGQQMYGEFGDTFWWTYYFNRGSHYY